MQNKISNFYCSTVASLFDMLTTVQQLQSMRIITGVCCQFALHESTYGHKGCLAIRDFLFSNVCTNSQQGRGEVFHSRNFVFIRKVQNVVLKVSRKTKTLLLRLYINCT
ncbi:hypothetical protein Tcan_00491, partial [Toxocara canis]